jgi:2-amino-4-hydroxy-6-hydroxymethyldihydropteridine diphosphokinase
MKVFLQLGTNDGNKIQNLLFASNFIKSEIGTIIKESSIYKTEPWNMPDEKEFFLNQVLLVETQLSPQEILNLIKKYEQKQGRRLNSRNRKNYDRRVIDIDILFYEDIILNTQNLIIPHPLLHIRRFVLIPLNEIAHDFVHPVFNKSVFDLLLETKDNSNVVKFEDEVVISLN